mgnify:CR=1 FL=1
MPAADLASLGVALILAGFIITIIAILLLGFSRGWREKGEGRGGAVIVLGPIPIVIGSDPSTARTLMLLAVILLAAAAILFLAMRVI